MDHKHKFFVANIIINGNKLLDIKDGQRVVKQSRKSYIKLFMNSKNTFLTS